MFISWLPNVPAVCEVYLKDICAEAVVCATTHETEFADQTCYPTQSVY